MGAPKGNQYAKGNKGGGRKTIAEEFKSIKEKITQEVLIELANKKVFAAINDADDHNKIKEIALPITLKGMTDKFDFTTKGKSLNYKDDQRRKIAERIIRRKSDIGGSGEKLPG